ncbi:hypothetical protein [Rhodocyclus tenuis]|uniref:Uncharacterized protein n=1 Tax=Rhodocyclus tenuis TaxID=1066 RepID=A0A840GA70_RHOTE|nr:hypothetical protein [Rhodocyclus tenuis]MBB4248371.1 hypothetical protein [Rhodocyclus tenuis]
MSLRDALLALPQSLLLARNDAALAAMLSVDRTRRGPRLIGIGTILDTLGPEPGAALLDALYALRDTVPAIKWAWVLIDRGELDVSLDSVRGQIDALVSQGVMTAAQAGAINSLAEVADPVSVSDVSAILNAEGY